MKNVYSSGWGWTDNNGHKAPVALQEKVEYIKHQDCVKTVPKLDSHQLCTHKGHLDAKRHAGRPLFSLFYKNGTQQFKQIGIFTEHWREENDAILMYTNVTSFIYWIAFKISTY